MSLGSFQANDVGTETHAAARTDKNYLVYIERSLEGFKWPMNKRRKHNITRCLIDHRSHVS